MRQTIYLFLALLPMASFSGCQSEQYEPDTATLVTTTELAKPETTIEATPAAPPQRKLIKVANLRFQVKDVSTSEARVEQLIETYNAAIVSSHTSNAEESIETTYTIRVEPGKFPELVKALQQESIFLDDKTITSDDVTRQYVDVEARIKTMQAVEQRYLQLLHRADKIPDILAIEGQLKKLREELESMQAQFKALKQQISYSTIHLNMYQFVPASYTDRTNFGTRSITALSGGWQFFKDLLIGLLYLWPLWVFLPLGLLAFRWLRRQYKSII